MFGASPFGSTPIGTGPPTYPEARDAIESADWTGIERRLSADPAAVERIQQIAAELNAAFDSAGLTNAEKAKAKALTAAIMSLVESPEPEWKVVARLLITLLDSQPVKAAVNATVIIGLIGGALQAVGIW